MSLTVTILGSSAAIPTVGQHQSAHALNVCEQFFLIDCGEGTQQRLVECGISPLKINAVFISHLHGDHCYGLLPLVSTLSLMGRKTPLKIFAPRPMDKIIESWTLYFSVPLGFEVEWIEVKTRENIKIFESKTLEVYSIPLRHRVPASGYLFREKEASLNVHKGKIEWYKLDIYQILAAKRGEDITLESGEIISNSELTYLPRKASSYAYCSDTSYSAKVADIVAGVDLLYHEATYMTEDKALAKATGHSTAAQAAKVAQMAGVGKLVIGHISPRYRKDYDAVVDEAREVFPESYLAIEGVSITAGER